MPHKMVNGVRVELTDAEIAELAANEAEWAAGEQDRQAAEVRKQRDKLLADSDWIVAKAIEQNAQDGLGVQIPVVWLDYRQELRDIPQQANFPDNVTWPNKP